MAKSDAERQRTLRAKREAEGWKRLWIRPDILKAVMKLLKDKL